MDDRYVDDCHSWKCSSDVSHNPLLFDYSSKTHDCCCNQPYFDDHDTFKIDSMNSSFWYFQLSAYIIFCIKFPMSNRIKWWRFPAILNVILNFESFSRLVTRVCYNCERNFNEKMQLLNDHSLPLIKPQSSPHKVYTVQNRLRESVWFLLSNISIWI